MSTEKEESPHAAFVAAYAYVVQYFEQLARLLDDATNVMAKHNFIMLRPQGDWLVGGESPKVGQAETWISSWLFAFYAKSEAFGGRKYGVNASQAARIPFVGLGLRGPEVELPALYLGWVELLEPTEEIVEKRAWQFYGAIEPAALIPTPEPVQSISDISWTPAAHRSEPLRVALARVPLELVTGPAVVDDLIRRLAHAVSQV